MFKEKQPVRIVRNVGRILGVAGLVLTSLLALLAVASGAAAAQQPANGITSPEQDARVGGVVIIEGTASDPSFLRYEIAFFQQANPVGWISFAEGDRPVVDGTLAIWDTTVGRNVGAPVFPDGAYQLRLRVVRQDYNYDEYFLTSLFVSNSEPTPTPTITATETVLLPTSPAELATPVPAILPTLTPFPTPSPQPTPADDLVASAGDGRGGPDENEGLLSQLGAVDTGLFSGAFWRGVTIVFYLFAALGAYLLLRGGARRLWRVLSGRVLR